MEQIILFIFLVIFPFGQIIRLGIIQPLDIIVGVGAFWAIVRKYEKPDWFKYFENFLILATFSWVVSIFIFNSSLVTYGLLYLVRLTAYFYFFLLVRHFAAKKKNKELLLTSLFGISIVSAVFGWIQFFKFPAFRAFMVWGWDEHLYRLAGTFLDPTYLGIILVFGILVSMYRYMNTKKLTDLGAGIFLLVSLAYTYSRASYLALFAGLAVFAWQKKILKKIIIVVLTFVALVLVLPTKENTVLKFTRQFSAIARIEDYQNTIKIFTKSPIFGIGYDNMCLANNKFIRIESFSSHSCSGSDSSLLFILATTGVVGFVIFAYALWRIVYVAPHNSKFIILNSSFVALLVHSLFSNSLFYPWVMGWIMILLAEA